MKNCALGVLGLYWHRFQARSWTSKPHVRRDKMRSHWRNRITLIAPYRQRLVHGGFQRIAVEPEIFELRCRVKAVSRWQQVVSTGVVLRRRARKSSGSMAAHRMTPLID